MRTVESVELYGSVNRIAAPLETGCLRALIVGFLLGHLRGGGCAPVHGIEAAL